MSTPLLSVRDLRIDYVNREGPGRGGALAVNGLSFDIAPGEALALVGESGCGKSTTAMALPGLLPPSARISGQAIFQSEDLLALPTHRLREIRGNRIGMIFQEPMTSLNPVHPVGRQIDEALQAHRDLSRAERRARVLDLLDLVALPDPARIAGAFPHELSGGQRQRVVIAMAIALEPALLIADEPTTALDATVQSQILALIDRLRRQLSMSLLLISHDLPVVARWTDRVLVMHHGEKLEELPSAQLFQSARHPYSQALIRASLRLGDDRHYSHGPLAEISVASDPKGTWSYGVIERPAIVSAVTATAVPELTPMLEARGLRVDYGPRRDRLRAVDGVSFRIAPGETLGLVGESGSGKSSLSRAVLGLEKIGAGSVLWSGQDIAGLGAAQMRKQRRRVQMVFQDPYGSLNPRQTVREVLSGVLSLQDTPAEEVRLRVAAMLDRVGLAAASADRYPHEFSGGQRQRIAIARALIVRPDLVICDEPVSALDVSIQAQILNLLVELKHELGLSYLFISHDLAVVRYISDRVMVMRSGRIVETADHGTIWRDPADPYTRSLIAAAA